MSYPRQYIFDGQSILLNKYDDVEEAKYDQNFEDIVIEDEVPNMNQSNNNFNQSTNQNFYNTNPMNSQTNYNQNMNQTGMSQNEYNQSQNNFNQTNYSNTNQFYQTKYQNNPQENNQVNYQLIPEQLFQNLKDEYYRQKGYMQTNPDELFKFFLSYRVKEKKHLKINKRIQPLLNYSNDDVNYSIQHYNKIFMENLQSQMNGYSTQYYSSNNYPSNQFKTQNMNKTNNAFSSFVDYFGGTGQSVENSFKPKFTNETMRRLYPKQKEIEQREESKMNVSDFQSFFSRLLDDYEKKNGKLTNNENNLMNHWKTLNENEQKKKGLQWEYGENNLEDEMNIFLSDDEIIKRLCNIFKKSTGTFTTHPRPLHDYWEQKIKRRDKYYKGLAKYGKDNFYNILESRYNLEKEDKINQKEKEEEDRIKKEKEERESKKLSKEEKEELYKKFDQLSKPKDRYKTGRVMINLRNQFKYDNIIKKMIKTEFQDNKLFKFPEEYAVRDTDEERKILFKNSLEKGVLNDNKIKKKTEKIKEYMTERNDKDIENEEKEKDRIEKILYEDRKLENYIKSMVIKYYKKMQSRLSTGKIELISNFLNQVEQNIRKNFPEAAKRKFGNKDPSNNQNAYKYKKLHKYYSDGLKYYFFKLLRRLGVNEKGKFVFAKTDNLSFWGPAMSNNCKVHTNGCPLYCTHNSHNTMILEQREKNFNEIFNNGENNLQKDEKFNMWRRPELIKEKEKIFMCLDDARQCTFEPNINKTTDDIFKINNMNQEELVATRANNDKWIDEMGENFSTRFPVVFKDGVCKKAKIAFASGKFDETNKILEKAFNIDDIKAYFEPKYAIYLKKKREEERIKEEKRKNDPNQPKEDPKKKKKQVIPDNFNNAKNKEICLEVYMMIKAMEDYKKNRKKTANKLKDEIAMIEFNKKILNNETVDTKSISVNKKFSDENPKFTFIKDKYFNYFKTIMCPLKNQCPYDLRPRWPHSDINAVKQFGGKCPYAHQVSELKFEQEINEKIKLRKNLLKTIEKDLDPKIDKEWFPSGPIVSCNGCGKNSGGKQLCNFCKYHQKNNAQLEKDKKAAKTTNERILKKIKYEGKPEEIDQDYMRKFGMLKKAITLYSFRRYTDADKIITQLHNMVQEEQAERDEKFRNLDIKWRKKLENNQEIPKEVLNYQVTQSVLDHFKIKIPLSTFLVYSDKMRKGNKFSIYNRHTYLNRQIEEFYDQVRRTMAKYDTNINQIKERIILLEKYISKGKKLQHEEPENYEKLNTKYKTFKDKMCSNLHPDYTKKIYSLDGREIPQSAYDREEIRKYFCKCGKPYDECDGAHNPNQLNLIKPTKDKQLMENNVRFLEAQKKQSSVIVPWSYPKQGFIEPGPLFEKSLVKQYGQEFKRTKSAKKLGERDLEKLRLPYHEI